MNALSTLQNNPRAALFDAMDAARAGMLGLTAPGHGLQPMTHFPDRGTGQIWFVTSDRTELAQAVGSGVAAQYCVISKGHDLHAAIRGMLFIAHDGAKLDEIWSPVAAAWFDGGRDDPHIALLRFDPEVAHVWASTTNPLKFGLEILRANMADHHEPDLGDYAEITFTKAV